MGPVQGLWGTVKAVCLDPDRFWTSTRPTGLWDALSFAWIIYAITAILGLPLSLLTSGMQSRMLAGYADKMRDLPPEARAVFSRLMGGQGFAFTVGMVLVIIMFFPIIVIIGAAIIHLFCLMLGCGKSGFEATVRSVGYAVAPMLIGFIPCLGILGSIYSIVLVVWGIYRLQNTTVTKAILAVLLPILVPCCCCPCVVGIMAGVLGKGALS